MNTEFFPSLHSPSTSFDINFLEFHLLHTFLHSLYSIFINLQRIMFAFHARVRDDDERKEEKWESYCQYASDFNATDNYFLLVCFNSILFFSPSLTSTHFNFHHRLLVMWESLLFWFLAELCLNLLSLINLMSFNLLSSSPLTYYYYCYYSSFYIGTQEEGRKL